MLVVVTQSDTTLCSKQRTAIKQKKELSQADESQFSYSIECKGNVCASIVTSTGNIETEISV